MSRPITLYRLCAFSRVYHSPMLVIGMVLAGVTIGAGLAMWSVPV